MLRQKGKTNTMAKEETKECQGICRVRRAVCKSLRILQAVGLLPACSHIKSVETTLFLRDSAFNINMRILNNNNLFYNISFYSQYLNRIICIRINKNGFIKITDLLFSIHINNKYY